jgi:ParB family transcriptional regulator, chromosome partitioning protein
MSKEKPEKPRLGRGLSSLLGAVAESVGPAVSEATPPVPEPLPEPVEISHPHGTTLTRLIPINRIDPNPYQPRVQLDPQALSELVESIRQQGIVQPIVVRPKGDRYELVVGQRRLAAAGKLDMQAIPAVIRQASDQQVLEIALVENIQREDLNCVDRAQAYKNYQDTFHFSPDQIAERLGQDRTTVTNYLRLLILSGQVLDLLRTGRLSMGHARAIVGLDNPEEQTKMAIKTAQMGLSVRQTEGMVARLKSGKPSSVKTLQKSPNILDLEQQMTRSLSTKIQIIPARKKGSGKVVIDYYSLDDFDRILERICGTEREDL